MKKKENVNADGSITTTKTKKPFYKKKWFIAIVVLLLIGSIGNALDGDKKDSPQLVVSEQASEKEPTKTTESEVDKAEEVEEVEEVVVEEPTVTEKDVDEVDLVKAKQYYLDNYHDLLLEISEKDVKMTELVGEVFVLLSEDISLLFEDNTQRLFEIGAKNYGEYQRAVISMGDIKYLDDKGQEIWRAIRSEYIDYHGKWKDFYTIYAEGIRDGTLTAEEINSTVSMIENRTEQMNLITQLISSFADHFE